MAEKIKVIIMEPKKDPVVDWIPNTLAALQGIVGGYIEAVQLGHGVVAICNEGGRILGLPYNCTLPAGVLAQVSFVGTIVAVGEDGDAFADVPVSIGEWKDLFMGRR